MLGKKRLLLLVTNTAAVNHDQPTCRYTQHPGGAENHPGNSEASVFEDIKKNGIEAAMKYYQAALIQLPKVPPCTDDDEERYDE